MSTGTWDLGAQVKGQTGTECKGSGMDPMGLLLLYLEVQGYSQMTS